MLRFKNRVHETDVSFGRTKVLIETEHSTFIT